MLHFRFLLHQHTYAEELDELKNLIRTGQDLNPRDEEGNTPIHIAAKFNKHKALKLLLKNGANMAAVNNDERNALHIAAENSSLECVQVLLEHGIDQSKVDKNGLTAFMIAKNKNEVQNSDLRHRQQFIIDLLNMRLAYV